MLRAACAIVIPTAALLLLTPPASAQEPHDHPPGEQIGQVVFPTSCSDEVAVEFERGVAMLHSFWFEQALDTFTRVAAADSGCAMAQWGIAMVMLGNPFTGVEPDSTRQGIATTAVERAFALSDGVTPRELGYIEAVAALYQHRDSLSFRERMQEHERRMLRVHERNPEDAEATIFLARAMVANAPPDDLSYERQLAAASLLEPLFVEQPEHPGLAHYLIHASDAPSLARHGLDAARRYAEIAPDAPHALHMPSHIFTRLGYWDESIETNIRSAAAEPNPDAAVHPMDYLVYAYLQQGRDSAAAQVVSRAVAQPDRFYSGILGYNFAAMPARQAVERSMWRDAARLAIPTGGAPPYVSALTHFARAIGAARSGAPEAARADAETLADLRDELDERGDGYWSVVVGAQALAAESWIAHAEGRKDDALRLAREAAELEETVEKHPVTPGPLLPARELLGDLLMEMDRPREAMEAYDATLEREPNRARALFGAARAAELAGEESVARKRYGELLELMREADPTRQEVRLARRYLAGR